MRKPVLTFRLDGLKQTLKALKKFEATVISESKNALKQEMDAVLKDALAQVPVKSGRLKKSGRVEKVSETKNTLQVNVTFGGTIIDGVPVDYAREVEARTKFASRGWRLRLPSLTRRIARRIAEKFRRS